MRSSGFNGQWLVAGDPFSVSRFPVLSLEDRNTQADDFILPGAGKGGGNPEENAVLQMTRITLRTTSGTTAWMT